MGRRMNAVRLKRCAVLSACLSAVSICAPARAQTPASGLDGGGTEPPPTNDSDATNKSTAPPPSKTTDPIGTTNPPVAKIHSGDRAGNIVPKAAELPPPGRLTFSVDPIADGAIIAGAAGFAGSA
jgi:hypothetical protein